LHEFFNDEYDLWFKNVDTIAEHIRQHPEDNLLPFSLPALAEGLKTFEATTDADALTKNYLQYLLAFESLVAKGDKAFEHPADIDLLGELSRVVEKSKWKTESILKVKQ
jgi:DNA-binding ferritin-like protein